VFLFYNSNNKNREGEYMENVKFNNLEITRYVKVKDSIEDLMKIIDLEKTKEDGMDRVLTALLQLIDQNDNKTVDEKYEAVNDAIYNGNVFSHYFKEENKEDAVHILSNTSLLNDDERFVYIVNFYMPNDINFGEVYKECGKSIDEIVNHYGLPDNEESRRLVYGRVLEIAQFFKKYQEEKERQVRFAETEALAALQDVSDIPSEENIQKAEELLNKVTASSLKETLENQLNELKGENNMEKEEMFEEVEDLDEVSEELEPVEVAEIGDNIEESEYEEVEVNVEGKTLEEYVEENAEELEEVSVEEIDYEEDEETFEVSEELDSVQEEMFEEVEVTEASPVDLEDQIEENEQLEVTIHEEIEEPKELNVEETIEEDNTLGQDVMKALNDLVNESKQNASRAKEAEETISVKEEKIKELENIIEVQQKELDQKDIVIKAHEETIKGNNVEIELLTAKFDEKEKELNEANIVISKHDQEISLKDAKIIALSNELNSYKAYLTKIQSFVMNSSTKEEEMLEKTR